MTENLVSDCGEERWLRWEESDWHEWPGRLNSVRNIIKLSTKSNDEGALREAGRGGG